MTPSSLPDFDPVSPFSRAVARRAGLSQRELQGPRYRKLFYDVYVCSSARRTALLLARGALSVSAAGAFVSHHTAAALWGGCVPDTDKVHVSVPDGARRSERTGIAAHRARGMEAVCGYRGVPLSSPRECFRELAADGVSLVDLVVLGDSLVKAKRFTPEQLVAAAGSWTGPGSKLARVAAKLVRGGVDSAMESRLRLLIVFAGLPEPQVNFIVRDSYGGWLARFDLCYSALKLVIEYDGRQHGELGQWKRDSRRRELLDSLGWRLVVIHADGIYDNPLETLERVLAALRQLGYPALPRVLKDGWRRHFPVRG